MLKKIKNVIVRKKGVMTSDRPYIALRRQEINDIHLKSLDCLETLNALVRELSFRNSFASKRLKLEIEKSIELIHSGNEQVKKVIIDDDEVGGGKNRFSEDNYPEPSNINRFKSFFSLVKDITSSTKPETLIDSCSWEMMKKSIKSGDEKYNKLDKIAATLKLDWPLVKREEEIRNYLDLSLEELKDSYGWEQKRVIISAVAMASYAKVKSRKLLEEKYGSKETPTDNENVDTAEIGSTIRRKASHKTGGVNTTATTIHSAPPNKTSTSTTPSFFNSLLNFKAPWNCIKEQTWNLWRENINHDVRSLTVGHVSKQGQFPCKKNVQNLTVAELANVEFSHLFSFPDPIDRKAVFLTIAFLGLGNNIPVDLQMTPTIVKKSIDCPERTSIKEPTHVSPKDGNTIDDILEDFGL